MKLLPWVCVVLVVALVVALVRPAVVGEALAQVENDLDEAVERRVEALHVQGS